MFLSLTVENFLSIRDEAFFNLEASLNSNHHPDHVFPIGETNSGVLKTAGIYGANASGKSNILKAFGVLHYLIVHTGNLKDGEILDCYKPYKLSFEKSNSPTKISTDFIVDNVRYKYKVSFNSEKILDESLDFYPGRAKANIFTRTPDDNWETIKFGGHYKGGAKKVAFFKNNSYLSKAGNNASTPQLIRDIYNFFRLGVARIGVNSRINLMGMTASSNRENVTSAVSTFMGLIDTGISEITYKEIDASAILKLPEGIPEEVKEQIIAENSVKYFFEHENEDGNKTHFEEHEESDGTQKIFHLSPLFMGALISKKVIIFDELENSLHPHIADLLIKLFNDPQVNIFGSQLIFSTHNIQLMSPEKMRREQLWFVEKENGKTKLFSLADFDKNKVKVNTPYSKWYDDGRFGAVPHINYSKIKEYLSGDDGVSNEETSNDEDIFGTVDNLFKS